MGRTGVSTHERLQKIVRDLFNDRSIVLTDQTTPADIPGWDSLAHVNLMFSIEQEFRIQFDDQEFVGFSNVGDLKRLLDKKESREP